MVLLAHIYQNPMP
ncbi:hypothetical protein F383_30408 [Gossypium arboreum]|uniref:Uncharacterized protein n=1 Tax=Gossypium arboreum TaxID=29729 RepID=A0A0B0PJC5_GOSAR|nr:hypothetical protein F383_30408 [Gossypium arboreum]